VVAAGSGHRFGGTKQFHDLCGRTVASWSLAAARAATDGVVLVVPAEPGEPAEGALPSAGSVTAAGLGADAVVTGGATRAGSVRAGLAAVPEDAAIVVVHDAVRPLAAATLFAAVIDAVRSGVAGAIPTLPIADTVKRVEGDRVVSTVDREGLVTVQTPQAFDAATLRRAHRDGAEATDDAGLLEQLGASVRAVSGDPRNVKVTRPEDLELAAALLRARPA
jgi:2-C-methyl-D-erythritol 4-phosphate cytidylyltransferase